ncbi:membrane protein PM19L-like [Selaginella moellendorffii]|uniref:membrane protein PM19L-like n=1 Tax=Selaginella moellendorffii TaxID=88036 RepID=UPI000D1C34A7|nr:membrane protein PM19L-like [Selaginella moellendorffii]|eukprot:XP_024532677.1 membrane protein PM19L-like [Selaginella moellendorffii]
MVRQDQIARALSLFSLLALTTFYVITIALASWALNRAFKESTPGSPVVGSTHGNAATPFLALTTLISGVVGMAAVILGLQHVASWKAKTLIAANAATIIAWALSLLAMGLACREVGLGGRRDGNLRSLEGFVIFLPWVLLVQMVTWQAAMVVQRVEHAPPTTPRMTV